MKPHVVLLSDAGRNTDKIKLSMGAIENFYGMLGLTPPMALMMWTSSSGPSAMPRKMKEKRVIPAFKSEAEEAEWWYKNRARLDKDLVDAARKGKLKRLDQATLKAHLAASKSRVVSIRLPEDDIDLARQQATEKGLPYQTYIKSVLHQALTQAK